MPHRKVENLDTVADRLEEIFANMQATPTDISTDEFLNRRFSILQSGLIDLILDLQKSAIAAAKSRKRR